MRVQCCICSDRFTEDESVNISALPCGHTFHEECLMRWMNNSSSCPHCRKKITRQSIIRKLYFDKADDLDGDEKENPDKVYNDLQNLKVKLKQRDTEKADFLESIKLLRDKLTTADDARDAVHLLFKNEQSNNSALRQQLRFFESQEKAVQLEREDYKVLKRKVADLHNIDVILNGCEGDAAEILNNGDNSGANKQLATYSSVLKREYERTKSDKKELRSELDRCKLEMLTKSKHLSDRTSEVSVLHEQLKNSENDLKRVEKEKETLKKKVQKLRQAIRSPVPGCSSSFIEALQQDSPAQNIDTTPRCLRKPSNPNDEIDLDDVPTHLVSTPDIINPSPNTERKRHCEENNIKFVKICSASDQNPAKKPKREVQDTSNVPSLGSLNIFKKKSDYNSVIRNDYNGLGGHSTFTQSSGGSFKFPKKKPSTAGRMSKNCFSTKAGQTTLPNYPKLDNFVVLD